VEIVAADLDVCVLVGWQVGEPEAVGDDVHHVVLRLDGAADPEE